MKKTRRFLAVLISVLMLVAALPFGSSAANVISSVDIQLNIAPGVKAENYSEYFSVNTDGFEPFEESVGSEMMVFDDDGYFVFDEFEMGETYSFAFCLVTKPGYSLPGSEFEFQGVTVNGGEAEFYIESFEYDDTVIEALVIYADITIGGTITDIDLDAIVYGDMPVSEYYRYVTLNSQGVDFVANSNSPVKAFDSEGNEVNGNFKAGEDYTLEIYLEPKTSCNLAKNENGEFALTGVTVNGETAEYTADSYTTNAYYEYVKIVTTVTAKEAKYITSVEFELKEDLDGVAVADWEDYISIKTEGLKFESYLGDPAVFVDDSNGYTVDTFEDGEIYYMYVYFSAEDGYFFPYDECLESVTVNGEDYSDSYYFDSYTAEDGTYIYYMCIEMELDLVGDGFFARLSYFFRNLFNWLQSLIFGFAI